MTKKVENTGGSLCGAFAHSDIEHAIFWTNNETVKRRHIGSWHMSKLEAPYNDRERNSKLDPGKTETGTSLESRNGKTHICTYLRPRQARTPTENGIKFSFMLFIFSSVVIQRSGLKVLASGQ